jgi:hypothetical protein
VDDSQTLLGMQYYFHTYRQHHIGWHRVHGCFFQDVGSRIFIIMLACGGISCFIDRAPEYAILSAGTKSLAIASPLIICKFKALAPSVLG